jgi:replicative DNA helicase
MPLNNDQPGDVGSESRPFGPNEEKAIVSLALDYPEFFAAIASQISHKYFYLTETRWVMAIIEKLYNKSNVVPSRGIVRDYAIKNLTVDDDYDAYLQVIDRKSDPREVILIKDTLIKWTRERAFGQLYSEEVVAAYENQDYETIEKVFEEARKITDVTTNGMWFFHELESLFQRDTEEKLTCGFPKLDEFLNEGGPTRGEVLCWMAPTGVGKSILLPHAGIACLKRKLNVLHVTLEMSRYKTALRYCGAMTNVEVHKRFEEKQKIKMQLEKLKATFGERLAIYEFPPDEINVDHIQQLLSQLRRQKGWNADVLVIDYLDLMVSRRASENASDYTKQKAVATQVRGLARNEKVLIFTATQTNREEKGKPGQQQAGNANGGLIDLNRVAESYGKMMPLDYVVTANQSRDEYNTDRPQLRLFIAKNRNGPKFKTITVSINYKTFRMEELQPVKATAKE